MANLNAILKNKMGLSAEQAKKSKVLASLSGSYRQNMKSIHYTQLVSNINQFYSEKELENLADVIQILGGVAQNLLVRKKDAEQYEILAGHRRWRASQIVVQRGFPEYAYLPCLVIECNDDVAELLLILTNSSARNDLNGYEQMMQVVRLKELLPKINAGIQRRKTDTCSCIVSGQAVERRSERSCSEGIFHRGCNGRLSRKQIRDTGNTF